MATEYVVDGAACTSLEATAAEFTRALALDLAWHGNLDALNDFLNGGFGTPDEGFVLVWRGSAAARRGLGYEATALWFEERSHDAHSTNREGFRLRATQAREETGETLFAMIVAIINGHEDVQLRLE